MTVAFVVPGEPKSKSRHRSGVRNGRMYHYKDEATATAQATVGVLFRQAAGPVGPPPDDDGFGVSMDFYLTTRRRHDVDNFVKLVLDGLTGVAWKDDSQVTEIHARIHHLADHGRSEIEVYETNDWPKRLTNTCENCGKDFRTYPSWSSKKYCGQTCMSAAKAKARAKRCAGCGESFSPRDSKTKYCSAACYTAATTLDLTCDECGSGFRRPRSQMRGRRTAVTCSEACHRELWRKRRAKAAAGTCEQCGGSTSKKAYTRCRACTPLSHAPTTPRTAPPLQ
jgi:Holliday junction resolvase RusA-like endonuclease